MIRVLLFLGLVGWTVGDTADLCAKCRCSNSDRELDCSNLELTSMYQAQTWNGTKFVKVNFNHNNLVHLLPFPPSSIEVLILSHNQIAKMEDSAFRDINNLTELDLSHNHLTSDILTPPTFRGRYSTVAYEPISSLLILRLGTNSLHTLHPDVFEHLPNIRELYLDSNPFEHIDIGTMQALATLPKLEVLDLSSTQLYRLPELMLHTPRFLRVLNISYNLFDHIPKSLGEAHSLRELNIDANPIIELKTFPKIETLQVLRMSYMKTLTKIDERALSKLINLREFYCTFNPHLTEIAENAFAYPLESPSEGSSLAPIKKLILRGNSLQYLKSTLVSSWDDLEELDLQENKWVCDCENQWMISTLYPTIERKKLLHTTGLKCSEPEEMTEYFFYNLSMQHVKMRCLDSYGNHPEKDGKVLIIVLVLLLVLISSAMIGVVVYRRNNNGLPFQYSRASYRRAGSMESFA